MEVKELIDVPNLNAALQRTADLYGDRVAIVDSGLSLTWSDYIERIACSASALIELGLKRGQRFGIFALNSSRQAEITNAGYWCGAVPVPINYRLAPPEIRLIIEDAGCKFIVVDPSFAVVFADPTLASLALPCIPLSADGKAFESDSMASRSRDDFTRLVGKRRRPVATLPRKNRCLQITKKDRDC